VGRKSGYPPPEIAALQRLNRPDRPRFHCSAAGPAVFYELHARKGDLIAFSRWEAIESLYMHNLGFHPRAELRDAVLADFRNFIRRPESSRRLSNTELAQYDPTDFTHVAELVDPRSLL